MVKKPSQSRRLEAIIIFNSDINPVYRNCVQETLVRPLYLQIFPLGTVPTNIKIAELKSSSTSLIENLLLKF